LEGLALEDVSTFYGHLVYFIWYIVRSFGIFYGHLVYFPRFGMLYQDKSGNPEGYEKTIYVMGPAWFACVKIR
jgi:hypothetical protein